MNRSHACFESQGPPPSSPMCMNASGTMKCIAVIQSEVGSADDTAALEVEPFPMPAFSPFLCCNALGLLFRSLSSLVALNQGPAAAGLTS